MKKFTIVVATLICLVWPLHILAANSDEKVRLVKTYMEQAIEEYQIPAASLAIVQNGEIIYQDRWGIQSTEEQVTADTVFTIGSISKPLTSLAIMKLVDEGEIQLDENIDTYLPSFEYQLNGFGEKITVRHLLSHTSGISSYEGLKVSDQNFRGDQSINEAVKMLNGVELNHEPGTVHQYSPANYLLLGKIIENSTGQTFSSYMRDEIYMKLDMHDTVSSYKEASILGYQPGYHSFFGKPIKSKLTFDDSGTPYGYTVSTGNDMVKFIQHMLDRDVLLSNDRFEEYISPEIHRKEDMYYGLGWRIATNKADPYIYHGGETPDSRSELYINFKEDYGFILLTNKNDITEVMTTISMREGIKSIMENGIMPEMPKMSYHMQWIPLLLTILLTIWGIWNFIRLKNKTHTSRVTWNIVGLLHILFSIVLIPAVVYMNGSPWNTIYHFSYVTAIFILCIVGLLALNGFLIIVRANK
ncbi:serine hydrolase domain-containing protein [Ornithinibacillus scapharcae]|uniref:serine hydrolase domain-containing protein n=1 Tax=Ornithinibacillus scapharcae TaxID=1147159 RepID=UPI000225B821|nr:serine hydrolase domain-containing protein [Ornithinibacillus scapharcae]